MFSDVLKAALEREVIGQPRAVHGVVRGVTRMVSGLTPRERPWCAFLFMGPTGTGKTHLIQSLARVLGTRMVVADCSQLGGGDPWLTLTGQLTELFQVPRVEPGVLEAPSLSMVRIEYLERGPSELPRLLAVSLENGFITLPGGRHGSLRNCLVFVTSSLCSREILEETTSIGFSGASSEEDEEDRVYKLCLEQAEKKFGSVLTGRLDGLILFGRLEEPQLGEILDRMTSRLNQWLEPRGFHCGLLPAARAFLLERGCRDLRLGARELLRAHRRLVEFPLADLLVSGRIPVGGFVQIDREADEDHLHFTVQEPPDDFRHAAFPREVPVVWDSRPVLH